MMPPPIDTIRISSRGREQLIKVKRQTGIENWNIISRWALCVSLAEPTEPIELPDASGDGVEMAWKVFAGEFGETISAVVKIRHLEAKELSGTESLADYMRRHIHRGLGYLTAGQPNKSVSEFLEKHARS